MGFFLKIAPFELSRLRPSDRRSALLLTFYFFLAMATVILIKSLQNALYITEVGVTWLPALYIALALLSGPIVLLYRYLAGRYSPLLLSTATLATLAVGLVGFWILKDRTGDWIYQGFYLWCAIFSVLVPTQGWFVSYNLFSPRTAKKVFIVLGMGGILGGVFGGYYTAVTATYFGFSGLFIHVLILLLTLEIVLVMVLFVIPASCERSLKADLVFPRLPHGAGPVKRLLRSRFLVALAGLILMTAFTSTLIDLQFKWAINEQFQGSVDQVTQIFGGFLGTVFLVSALVQLLGTNRILRNFGLGVGLLILPLGVMFGASVMILSTALWSVAFAKVLEGSLRSSIEQTSVELLYVPVSERENIPLKSFMELVVLRLGDGLGAALFLCFSVLGFKLTLAVPVVILLVGLVWLLATRRITEEYVRLLRKSLEFIDSKAVRRALEMDEAVAENTLLQALRSPNMKKVHFALQQLHFVEADPEMSDISGELGGDILSMDVSTLARLRSAAPRWLNTIAPFVEQKDDRVAAAALNIMISYNRPEYRAMLLEKLRVDGIPESRYLTFLRDYSDDPGEIVSSSWVLKWAERASPHQAVEIAGLMERIRDPSFLPVLRNWTQGSDRRLKRASIRAIGRFADPADIDRLIGYLPQNWSRRAARRALIHYGNEVVAKFQGLLRDPETDLQVKREIPSILTWINTSAARGVLVSALYSYDAEVAYRALKGLNRIRDESTLSYNQESFIPLLQIWGKEYYGLLNIETLLRTRQSPASRLLRKALKERIERCIEKIFRGLDLFLPRGDAYFSYLGFTSSRQDLRENAIELIDTRIKGELRQTLLPIFSGTGPLEVVKKGREIFKLPADPQSALSEAFFQADPWLRVCSIAAVKAEKIEELKDRIRQLCDDINPLVRQTASWALENWDDA